jgi:hypothetical protein
MNATDSGEGLNLLAPADDRVRHRCGWKDLEAESGVCAGAELIKVSTAPPPT